MAVNTDPYKASTQDYDVFLKVYSPRDFELSDVGTTGADDVGAYPPATDVQSEFLGEVDLSNVRSVGQVVGSLADGGYKATLTIQDALGSLPEFVGVEIWVRPYLGNVPGAPTREGFQDKVRIFKGYAEAISSKNTYPSTTITFNLSSSHQFTRGGSLSRALEFGPDVAHGSTTMLAAIHHLVEQHTNLLSRSQLYTHLDDYPLARLTLNQAPIHDMLMGCMVNTIEGFVYFDRDDNLHVKVHPNLAPVAWADEFYDPVVELDDDMVLDWDIPEASSRTVASVTLSATTSDFSPLTVVRAIPSGFGSHDTHDNLRYDSVGPMGPLADRLLIHGNRRYRNVVVTLPIQLTADHGMIVALTHRDVWRGISWQAKQFLVTGVSYNLNTDNRQFTTALTLDEVLGG